MPRATASPLRYSALTFEGPIMSPYCARLLPACVACVSLCRTAAVRWGTGAFPALQMRVMFGTRHQGKAGLHVHGLTRTELSAVEGVTADRLRTRKPFIHAVVAVSPVSAVQISTTRGQRARPVCMRPCRLVPICHRGQRQVRWGTPAHKVLPALSQARVKLSPKPR